MVAIVLKKVPPDQLQCWHPQIIMVFGQLYVNEELLALTMQIYCRASVGITKLWRLCKL